MNVVDSAVELLRPVITAADNVSLCKTLGLEEVKEALWSIPSDSSLGLDGFSANFFVHAWDIIQDYLLEVAKEFFGGRPLTMALGATNIVLIPKVEAPSNFAQFRPISLCSVICKVLSKIMVTRLASLLEGIISLEQAAFVRGRSIFDNISIAQEMVHDLHKNVRGGNILMILDMAKAYDRVNWWFLLLVLKKVGFSKEWRNLIFNCISSPFFSIMLNGMTRGFFKPSRGLRQGDPLSPYLFILTQKMLSRLINRDVGNGRVIPFHTKGMVVHHLAYADDLLLFLNGGKKIDEQSDGNYKSVRVFIRAVVSKEKSTLIFSKHITNFRRKSLLALTGFREGGLPCTYLGLPLYTGQLTAHLFDPGLSGSRKKRDGIPRDTRGPKMGVPLGHRLVRNSFRCIQDGDASFWFDHWVGEQPIADLVLRVMEPSLKVKDLLHTSGWDYPRLCELVGEKLANEIWMSRIQLCEGKDYYVWQPSTDGKFSTKSAWELIRQRENSYPWKNGCGIVWFPKKMSLGKGDIALRVLKYFASHLNLCLPHVVSWKGMMQVWWSHSSTSTQLGILRGFTPIIISWDLWKV
ncbi:uncharacterized protein LOC111389988 [Olea europaea var. sylvestris]|uniref:uncharacterized protein LOC111389988 n=1 Tax=Olea europaea var. sylvestris TaxID=158386 RepID=UPI000C1D4D43|nr:uncharacterized protein LOC111389988 [Olea europaea var. sylvestris]